MRRLPALSAAVLIALAPAAARPPAPAHPALWRLADADTTVWLFGTIHLLPAGTAWRDAAIDRAIAASSRLTLEIVIDRDPGAIAAALFALGRQAGLPPLAERVPPGRREALAALVARSGVPAATLDGMKTWAAAVVLTGPAMAAAGLDPARDEGVEVQLSRLFRAGNKPVDGLETAALQFGFFDALPEAAQRAFLLATLDDPAKGRRDFARMIRAWARGDVRAIAASFAEDPEFTPALREQLIARRDRAWAEALAARLATPGTSFVAVGAGHLAGPDSVQRMLADRGLKVERVR